MNDIVMVLLASAFSNILGVAIGIIIVATPEKRKKYERKALIVFFAVFMGVLFPWVSVIFLEELDAHFQRRWKFKRWKKKFTPV